MGLNEDTFLPRVRLNARRPEAIARDQRRERCLGMAEISGLFCCGA
jgi:hypothetical protein